MIQTAVAVIDFGGQFSQLIVRRIRELEIYSELVPWEKGPEWIEKHKPPAVILSGGPKSVHANGAPNIDFKLIEGKPTLGICYGLQLIANNLGGKVENSASGEYGVYEYRPLQEGLLTGITNTRVLMNHGDRVIEAPPGFKVTAETDTCPVAAFENPAKRIYGMQWHPEVSHSESGMEMLRRFLFDVAGLQKNWTTAGFIEQKTAEIKETVGEKKVLCAVSGGVDSTVMAALIEKAVPSQSVNVFVNSGLLRKNEAEEVESTFKTVIGAHLHVVDAIQEYFSKLAGVTEPEAKRKIVGREFISIFERNDQPWSHCSFLAQGTLYPDVIESGSSSADTIKSHHNVGGLPDVLKLPLLEPFRWLFKDEVRRIGVQLGLPASVIEREPFPGPGLSIRIVGEVTPEKVKMVQEADAIFRRVLKSHGINKRIWQSYAGLIDVKTVGVKGDARAYEYPIVLRAVQSEDAMTAKAVDIPVAVLEEASTLITTHVPGVNRVFYEVSGKPPSTIELE